MPAERPIDGTTRQPGPVHRQAAAAPGPSLGCYQGVLHFIPDADDPQGIVASLAAALAAGSFVTISHLTSDFAPRR